KDPDKVAKRLFEHTGCRVVIIDANDLGVEVLGKSSKEIETDFAKAVFRDNPLDQSRQQTPLCIVRKHTEG
ncbi:MAG: F420-0--gamma-glutamyl ligase, partial [Acutalibacteraceae bacterium]